MGRMDAALGTLILLRSLSEGPASGERLLDVIEEELGARKDARTLRRYLSALRETGFDVRRTKDRYELRSSPARLAFSGHEALATLNVVESLAEQEPVYGEHLSSAAAKLREALPNEALKFADGGRVDFDLSFASDPPENPAVLDVLRRATHRNQRVGIHYRSLSSGTLRWRTVEPLRLSYAQRAHRLYAHEPDKTGTTEFRINRIKEARMLPEKFSPEAHTRTFEPVKIRLSKNASIAYGKTVFHDDAATIEHLEDGGAIVEGTTPSTFWTVREIASLGPDAKVLGGPKLEEEFQKFLEETLNKYS